MEVLYLVVSLQPTHVLQTLAEQTLYVKVKMGSRSAIAQKD